jgi:hypothetical protein
MTTTSTTTDIQARDLTVGDVLILGEGRELTLERIGQDTRRGIIRWEGTLRGTWEGERFGMRTGRSLHLTEVVTVRRTTAA